MKTERRGESCHDDGLILPTPYGEARDQFRRLTADLGWDLHSHSINATGPTGEELSIDVCVSPVGEHDRTLVVSSGLHGIEGYFGSGAQLQQLSQWRHTPISPGMRIVMLHALNPFGYAWNRRVDEQNRDLNRNFLLTDESYAGSPELYAKIDPFLNPRLPPARWELFAAKALLRIARYRFRPLQSAIAGGQYDFPAGLFYGGSKPSELHLWLSECLPSWLDGSDRVLHLDLHTGLGKWGQLLLLVDSELSVVQRRDLDYWYGPETRVETARSKTAYPVQGSFGRWCAARSGVADYLYVCAEFGTVHPIRVLRALRAENQSYHWGDCNSRSSTIASQRLLDVFYPTSFHWRRQTLSQAATLIQNSLDGL